ncbi:uncharacterized protein LOC144129769 [Amblyomma americanum]
MDCALRDPRNLLTIQVDRVSVSALVDTGAHISVMSSDLRSRLRKVLTPAPTAVRVADGTTSPVLGLCAARVTISDRQTTVLFAVLNHCPHEILLDLDFLSEHAALIDCATSVVELDQPLNVNSRKTPTLRSTNKKSAEHSCAPSLYTAGLEGYSSPAVLCNAEFTRMPHEAATYVLFQYVPPLPNSKYVFTPDLDLPVTKNAVLAHTVVTVSANSACLAVLNSSTHVQTLPQGMCLATLSPTDEYVISTVTN